MIPYHLFKSILLCSCFLFFLPLVTEAQAAEQDCSGAIVVISSPDTFSAYSFEGSIQELEYPQNSSCLISGEESSVWITFTACDTGLLLFEITPYTFNDDFDWALYDFTNHTCADVFDLSNELRCNFSAIPGPTGLDTPFTMVSVPAGGPNQCQALHPYVNQRFLLLVNNHALSNMGFVLTFSGNATLCNTVSIPPIKIDHQVFLGPNPTEGMLQLKNLPAKNNIAVEVIDVYGNKVYMKELKGDNQLLLPPLLPNGFYVLRILEEGNSVGEESFIISR